MPERRRYGLGSCVVVRVRVAPRRDRPLLDAAAPEAVLEQLQRGPHQRRLRRAGRRRGPPGDASTGVWGGGRGHQGRLPHDQRPFRDLASKTAFKQARKRRRCLIRPTASTSGTSSPDVKRKQPYFIHRPDDEPIAFAGLWEVWRGPKNEDGERTGDPLRSCTIITTTPNDEMAKIHDRMPVILPPSAWDEWLDTDNDDIETLGRLLVPAPRSITQLRPVSTQVNSVRNKGPELIEQATPDQMVV